MWNLLDKIRQLLHCYDVYYSLFCLFMKGDVYPVEPYDGSSINQVLDAHWGVLNDEDVSYPWPGLCLRCHNNV